MRSRASGDMDAPSTLMWWTTSETMCSSSAIRHSPARSGTAAATLNPVSVICASACSVSSSVLSDRSVTERSIRRATVLVLSMTWTGTPIGKIDRAALPPIEFRGGGEYVAPRTELEATIATVVAAVLDLDRVSVDDGFFDIGGNSLSAAKVAARLASILDRPVSIEAVFEAPTAAGLAAWLVDTHTPGIVPPPLIVRPRAAVVPVSAVQRGLWLINQANPESSAYNVPLTLRLHGELEHDALRSALADVIARHETLRTMYPMFNGVPVQVINDVDTVLGQIDLGFTDLRERPGEVEQVLAAVTDTGFDVTEAGMPPMITPLTSLSCVPVKVTIV